MYVYPPSYVLRYPQKREAVKEVHNSVIYKASDVVYDLKHTACSSAESPRLRLIQVQSYVWCCMHTCMTGMIGSFATHPWYMVHSVQTKLVYSLFVPPHTLQTNYELVHSLLPLICPFTHSPGICWPLFKVPELS